MFHELTDALSHVLCMGWTPGCLTAVGNAILETEIFCRQYLNINNSCNKQCFLMKFGNSVADIFIIKHKQFG